MSHQYDRFQVALQRLVDWHVDSVKAQSFDGPSIATSKQSSRVLAAQSYPRLRYWISEWHHTHDREGCIAALEQEYLELSRRPYRLEKYRDNWGKTRYRKVARLDAD